MSKKSTVRKKGIEPEQHAAKEYIRNHLINNTWYGVSRLSEDTGVPVTTLYYWLNGRTLNLKTKVYWQRIRRWIKRKESAK